MRPANVPQPPKIAALPVDPKRGYPVPWFVEWIDGQPDFRVMRGSAIAEAVKKDKCWTCGKLLFGKRAYVVGPMCAVNRTSAEPPSHIDCARYSAQACPFLTKPKARRREAGKPEGTVEGAGIMLKRNPGVALVWITGSQTLTKPDLSGGTLFDLGTPKGVEWYAEGREATRAEIQASIDSGLPALQELADEQGPDATAALSRMVADAMRLLPAA